MSEPHSGSLRRPQAGAEGEIRGRLPTSDISPCGTAGPLSPFTVLLSSTVVESPSLFPRHDPGVGVRRAKSDFGCPNPTLGAYGDRRQVLKEKSEADFPHQTSHPAEQPGRCHRSQSCCLPYRPIPPSHLPPTLS